MKKTFKIVVLIFLITAGCQVMEIEQKGPLTGEVELSNVNNVYGKEFEAMLHSWYIIDLGPVYEASVDRTLSGTTNPASHTAGVTITTGYDFIDTILRAAQMAFIIIPVVGSRTIVIKGNEE